MLREGLWKLDSSTEAEGREQARQVRKKGTYVAERKVQGPQVAKGREDGWAVSSQ